MHMLFDIMRDWRILKFSHAKKAQKRQFFISLLDSPALYPLGILKVSVLVNFLHTQMES